MTTPTPNIGQQFLDRVQPMFAKLRKRPVGHEPWKDEGYSVIVRDHSTSTFNPEMHTALLYHNGETVGDTTWHPESGFVKMLEVDPGHTHMTAKLLQEAWDHATSRGQVGPAWSHDLNKSSSRLMAKFNPESEGYKRYTRDML